MTMGWTLPLTEVNTRNFQGGKAQPARKDDNITAVYEPTMGYGLL
jgi:hypothetical protein